MKTKITTLLIATLISFSVLAQDKDKVKTPPTPEEIAKQRTERMKEKLSLTPDQESAVLTIFLKESIAEQDERKAMAEQFKKAKERKEAVNAQVKELLTADQQAKLDEMKNKRPDWQKGREGKEGPRGEARAPRDGKGGPRNGKPSPDGKAFKPCTCGEKTGETAE